MKKHLNITVFCLAIFYILFPVSYVSASTVSEPDHVLKVAFPETPGINEIYENGTYGGTTYDFLMEIAKYTGWEYEFVTGDPGELLTGMMNGDYDLMGGMYYQEAWKTYFNYPKYVMGKNYNLLICRKDNMAAKRFDISTLNGMTIGVYSKASAKIKRLEYFLAFNSVDCTIKYFDDILEYEKCLESGEVDLMLGSTANVQDDYTVVAQFESDPYYIITTKGKPELTAQLNEALNEIYSANPNFADELYNKYFPDKYTNPIDFNESDKAFIENSQSIRVAVLKNRYPVYYEKDGQHHGIVPDLLDLISERTGLSFEYVATETYQDMLDVLKTGQADFAGCFMDDSYAASDRGLSLVKSYTALDSVILKNKSVTFPSDELVMAVPAGRAQNNTSINGSIKYYEKYEDCLEAVNTGDADYLRMPSAFVEPLYVQNYYPNVTIITTDNQTMALSLALPKPLNISLYSILSKTINNLSAGEMSDILSRNLVSSGERNVSLKSFIYSNPGLIIAIIAGFFTLLSAIVLITTKYKLKNKLMHLKMEKAVETAQVKSDFLSRMSHEIRTPMNAIIGLSSLTQMACELPPQAKENLDKINTSAQFLLSLVNDILDMSKIDSAKMKIVTAPFDLESLLVQMENMFHIQAQQKNLTFTVCRDFESRYLIGDEVRIKQVLTNLLSNACKFTESGGHITLSVKQEGRNEHGTKLSFHVIDNGIGIPDDDMSRIFDSFEQASQGQFNAQGTGLGLAISSSLVHLMDSELQVKSSVKEGSEFFFTLCLPDSQEEPPLQQSNTSSEHAALDAIHILLAEDNDLNAEIVISVLTLKGVLVERAADGKEAVEMFQNHPSGWYQLILMDIQMPHKDGLTATREIRSTDRPDAKSIPIIAMTANTFQEDRDNAKDAGMTGFVPKPFNVEQLYQTILESIT